MYPLVDPPRVSLVTDHLEVEKGKNLSVNFTIDPNNQTVKSDFKLKLEYHDIINSMYMYSIEFVTIYLSCFIYLCFNYVVTVYTIVLCIIRG